MDQAEVLFRPLSTIEDPCGDAGALMLQVLVSPRPRRCGDSDAAVVKLVGELDTYSAQLVEPALRSFVDYADDVTIDVSDLRFIDAAGLRLLSSLADGVQAVRLENAGARIARVLEIAGLSHLCDANVPRVAS